MEMIWKKEKKKLFITIQTEGNERSEGLRKSPFCSKWLVNEQL